MLPKLLFATPDGTVLEHPTLLALGRSGDDILEPAGRPSPLPCGARLVHLPGRLPIGLDPETGAPVVLDSVKVKRKDVVPQAVAAVFPPGWTRTLLPAFRRAGGPPLPQWAYAAAGWGESGPVAWALRTDRRTHWDPEHFSTPDLPGLVEERLAETPDNPVLQQLSKCALEYSCFTAQNVFYRRNEGALPSSSGCNARCAGCISQTRPGGPPSSMDRIRRPPSAEAMAEVGVQHLTRAAGKVMVSFGQGCEGEPLTRADELERAVRLMRAATDRGSIHINTNASRTEALGALIDAGLDSVRVSLNSAHPELYTAYYRPAGYEFADVVRSIALVKKRKGYLALNLLILPGVTDREGEVELLAALIRKHRVDQVQARSLAMDPDQYLEIARGKGAGGEPIGVSAMLARFKAEAPWLCIGNFSRAKEER